jgi:hypothetical protein
MSFPNLPRPSYSVHDQLQQLREDISTALCAAAAMLLTAPTAPAYEAREAELVRAHQLLVAVDAVLVEWGDAAKDVPALQKEE